MKKILFIHPRRGLFQLTSCGDCGFVYKCDACDANLITYKTWSNNMELLCHQCQSYYNYPKTCTNCKSDKLSSKIGGIDELVVQLQKLFPEQVIHRFDKKHSSKEIQIQIGVTTRVFDPAINYEIFDSIVFINSQNLLSAPDYLVREDTTKQIAELLLHTSSKQNIVFDTGVEGGLFDDLLKLNGDNYMIQDWYTDFVTTELKNRRMFKFPPFYNLILLTVQHRQRDKALENAKNYTKKLKTILSQYEDVFVSPLYPARFLKRKGLSSYHILIKYPKGYSKFFELRNEIEGIIDPYSVQVRLNPKHLF
jgi:primosomal protein N' (replication factor Y) (superfamily II helicase)